MRLAFAIGGLLIYGVMGVLSGLEGRDRFSQSDFPCHEDEALMFVESVSNDRLGCVSLDLLNGTEGK